MEKWTTTMQVASSRACEMETRSWQGNKGEQTNQAADVKKSFEENGEISEEATAITLGGVLTAFTAVQ